MRIMVPVDGSKFSEESLPMAFEIAASRGAELHITRVHSILPFTEVAASFSSTSMDELLREAEILSVQRLATQYADRGIVTRAFVLDGPVDAALAAHIATHGIDLVVMTTHGRGGISRAWLGSTADRLVRATSIPIVLVRPNGRRRVGADDAHAPRRILIPLDGSPLSESIIEPAIEFASAMNATFTLMHVSAPPISASAEASQQSASDVMQVRLEAAKYLETEAARLRGRGIEVTTRVMIQANVAAAIVEEAIESGSSFIAMATHGRSGWSRVALGSVADKVLRSATLPVLLMRPEVACVTARIA